MKKIIQEGAVKIGSFLALYGKLKPNAKKKTAAKKGKANKKLPD